MYKIIFFGLEFCVQNLDRFINSYKFCYYCYLFCLFVYYVCELIFFFCYVRNYLKSGLEGEIKLNSFNLFYLRG